MLDDPSKTHLCCFMKSSTLLLLLAAASSTHGFAVSSTHGFAVFTRTQHTSRHVQHVSMAAPREELQGIDMQRQLGEMTFSELASAPRDRSEIVSGGSTGATLGPDTAKVGLFYGQRKL